nr:helix-turn-helix domain-containing protein [Endozoicomonas sp.]
QMDCVQSLYTMTAENAAGIVYSATPQAPGASIYWQMGNLFRDNSYGIRALYKGHEGGRPFIYDETEVQRIKELVAEEPRRLSYVQSRIEDETGIFGHF